MNNIDEAHCFDENKTFLHIQNKYLCLLIYY